MKTNLRKVRHKQDDKDDHFKEAMEINFDEFERKIKEKIKNKIKNMINSNNLNKINQHKAQNDINQSKNTKSSFKSIVKFNQERTRETK